MITGTFSEHWHRVSKRRVGLRPAVQMRKQYYRGEQWYLVIDPVTNQFFRITPAAHHFLCRLDRGVTVEEVWEESLASDPDGAPGQEEVIQLLAQLHQSNLLCGDVPTDAAALLAQHTKRRHRELRVLLNFMAVRIPLFDPDRLLRRALPAARWLFSPLGAALWLAVVVGGIKVALDHAEALRQQSEALLAPGNLPLLYAGLFLIKTLHEFGHAFACRYFGGEVHRMGVMILYFSPVPYVDATSSWAFRSKWQRIFVASAGMLVEFFVAALAIFIWAETGEGLLHSLAYNIVFVASITTLLFNANPLLRYDCYYILSDLLEVPNLGGRSMEMLQHLAERWLFGRRASESPARSRAEAAYLAFYGIASWLYRLFVFIGIALWISSRWLLLGLVLALSCVFSFTVVPLWKLARYLASSPRLVRHRRRAVLVTGSAAAVVLSLLVWWPTPNRFSAPGILQAEDYSQVFTGTPGIVREILARSGDVVHEGQPLLRFENRELELELTAARAELARAVAEEDSALEHNVSSVGALHSRREVSARRAKRIEEQLVALVLIAPHAGTWVSRRMEESIGQWFPRGQRVGEIVQDDGFRFTAVISQEEAVHLFSGNMGQAQVRILGQAGTSISVKTIRVTPAQQELLPSAALGWTAGGEIATSHRDPSGTRAAEPFFELRAALAPREGVRVLHGRSGRIRVDLGRQPLLTQWYRKLRQLLQKKYQV